MTESSKRILHQWLEALKEEQTYERSAFEQRISETPLKERIESGLCWHPLSYGEEKGGFGQKTRLSLKFTQPPPQNHHFKNGKPVLIFQEDSDGKRESLKGIIEYINTNDVRVSVFSEELPDWVETGKLGLEPFYDERSYRLMEEATQTMLAPASHQQERLRDILIGSSRSRSLPLNFQSEALNQAQNQAVAHVLSSEDVALIHGPPGTGKTTTLVAAIEASLRHHTQILVCAPSNTAVDVLTQKISAAGIRTLRLGHPARVSPELQGYCLDHQVEHSFNFPVIQKTLKESRQLRQKALKYKRNFDRQAAQERRQQLQESRNLKRQARELEQSTIQNLLDNAQVITSTLTGAGSSFLKERVFPLVFIDEAAQALDGACWIPILKSKKVVLAGDHCQLPPTVLNPQAKLLSQTLFEKAMSKEDLSSFLSTQYRMSTEIMAHSNQHFYDGQLAAAPEVAQHRLLDSEHEVINPPLEWIDTAGCGFDEIRHPKTLSLHNAGEANILKAHLNALLEAIAYSKAELNPSIGVISPYSDQVHHLKKLLHLESTAHNLAIDSIDGFQGQEKDIIYISLVRTNDEGEIGFLKDLRRMNVAMTRARKKLVILGDSATLCHHPFYNELIETIQAQHTYRSAWEFLY